MRDLDLVSLRLFAAVCEMRNIARVGEAHNIVPSAISKRMTQLEDTVGVALLERNRKGVQATPAGETLLEHAKAILLSADMAARDMAAFRAGVRGKVRLLATVSSVAEFLPEDIAAFLQLEEHRDIQVDIEEVVSRDIAKGLQAGIASAGVCWDAADLSGLKTRPYRSDQLAIVAHPSHPLAKLKSCLFSETLDYEFLSLPSSTAGYALMARAAALEGRQIQFRSLLSTFDAVIRVVRANLGIAVAPVEVAAPYAKALGLSVIPLADAWALRHFTICYRSEELLTPAARLLIDFLTTRAEDANRITP